MFVLLIQFLLILAFRSECSLPYISYIMDKITKLEGGVSKKEIDFYRKALIKNGQFLVNKFQQNLVNNIFYKYFGDTVSINSINADDYITLIVIGKRILLRSGMKILPYIVSSAVVKISTRTGVCKKELMKIEQSEYYSALKRKYNGNEKIMKQIFSLIATTLSSSFKIIDYDEDNEKAGKYNGKDVVMENDIIIDEMIRFIIAI